MKILLLLFFSLCFGKIDVVIPCIEKDKVTLEHCIAGIKKHGKDVGNIYTISPKKLTDNAIWIDEKAFPFSKMSIAMEIFTVDIYAKAYLKRSYNRIGWVFQQLLKFYAHTVIKDLSPHFLVLDADLIFLKPVSFFDGNSPLFSYSCENSTPYFEHLRKLLPDIEKVFPDKSGVAHHMLFSKTFLDQLFNEVTALHNKPFWKALIACIDINELQQSCMSEYEIYFNYVFSRSPLPKLRELRTIDIGDDNLREMSRFEKGEADVASCPHYQFVISQSPARFLPPSKRSKKLKSF